MAKTKTSYTNNPRNEYHRLPNSAQKRKRNNATQNSEMIFTFELKPIHLIGTALVLFSPLKLCGWSLAIIGSILISAINVKKEDNYVK